MARQTPRTTGGPVGAFMEDLVRIGLGSLEGRNKSEYECSQKGNTQSEQKNASVNICVPRAGKVSRKRSKDLDAPVGKEDSESTTKQSQETAFGKQLLH